MAGAETDTAMEMFHQEDQTPSNAGSEVDASESLSFSDPYEDEEKNAVEELPQNVIDSKNAEVDDDYAMTFDSDGDENSDRVVVSNENIDQQNEPEVASVPLITETALSFDARSPSIPARSSGLSPPVVVPNGQEILSTLPNPISPITSIPGESTVTDTSTSTSVAFETDQSTAKPYSYEDVASGGIDIQQLLDNITAKAEAEAEANVNPTLSAPTLSAPTLSANGAPTLSPSGIPAHSSLPPRPMAAAQMPSLNAPYSGPPGPPPPSLGSLRPPGVPTSMIVGSAPGTEVRNATLPPPPAPFQPPPPRVQAGTQFADLKTPVTAPIAENSTGEGQDFGEVQFTPPLQMMYDGFLADERMYMNEGQWDKFPVGSRLFIGNLPSETATKKDVFYTFYKYGRLAQISIKQAYGFVQFHDAAACQAAIDNEQGQELRGRKMHLEISKPQKNTKGSHNNNNSGNNRQTRSPDRARGDRNRNNRGPGRGEGGPRGHDRYDSWDGHRDNNMSGRPRGRDDYRPVRSPSPDRGGFRGRDDYAAQRGRDYYSGRDSNRNRSRSPGYGRFNDGRYRERSRSPRSREADEDAALQIPRRDPRDVPDVQIILIDELDRNFVAWVENEIRARGLKINVLRVNPRMSVAAIIRRQILEKVQAVSQITRRSQDLSKIPLQVFNYSSGADTVPFDEYNDLEPRIAGELVLRAKGTQKPFQPPQYAAPQYSNPQFAAPQFAAPPTTASYSYQQPAPTAVPDLASIVGQLDNASLQQLLGSLNAAPAQQSASSIDLAGLLSGLSQPQQLPQQPVSYQGQQVQNTAYAAPVNSNAQQVENIMAQLARFRQ